MKCLISKFVLDETQRTAFLRMVEYEVKTNKLTKIPYGMWKYIKQFRGNENDIILKVEHKSFEKVINVEINSICNFSLEYAWLNCFAKFFIPQGDLNTLSSAFSKCGTACSEATAALDNLSENTFAETYKNSRIKNYDKNEREENSMFNFDFGVYNASNVRFSPYGLAIYNKGAGRYVAYNKETKDIVDVDILNFSADKMMYKIPVAISKVAVGDVILHTGAPMIVTKIYDSKLKAIDPSTAEEKTIIPIKSPFKFDFITKIISIVDFTNTNASVDSPFGNMLPFLMMGDNKELDPMLMAMMMSGGNMDFDMSNPFMWLMFSGKSGDTSSLLPMMMMMNQNKEVKESK